MSIAIYCLAEYYREIVSGLFIFGAALATAWFSFKQYREKQLTLQFQKFYFEDTLYGLSKSIDNILKCNENNMLNAEYLINMAVNIFDLKGIELVKKKEKLIELFISTRTKMEPPGNIRTLPLYILGLLIIKSQKSMLPIWLNYIELDSKRFLNHLTGIISKIEILLHELNENNILNARETLFKNIQEDIRLAYVLIERHQILFMWLSIITFKFVSADYTSNDKIFGFFKSDTIKEIINHINNAHKELITNYESASFDIINNKEELHKSMDQQRKIYANFVSEKNF